MHDPVSFGGGLVSQDLDHTTIQPVCAVSGPNCQHCAVAVCWECHPPLLTCFNCGIAHYESTGGGCNAL